MRMTLRGFKDEDAGGGVAPASFTWKLERHSKLTRAGLPSTSIATSSHDLIAEAVNSLKYDVDSLTGTYTTASWEDVGFNQDLSASIAASEVKKAVFAKSAFTGENTTLGIDTTAVGGVFVSGSTNIHGQTDSLGNEGDDISVGTLGEYADFDGNNVTIFISASAAAGIAALGELKVHFPVATTQDDRSDFEMN